MVISCIGFPFGDYFLQIPEGQTVTFKDYGNVGVDLYRYTSGRLHKYPSASVAQSYDPVLWQCPMKINYSFWNPRGSINFGSSMTMNRFQEGQSIQCRHDPSKIYRFTNNQLRWYPDPRIAKSWDPFNWTEFITIDCTGMRFGSNMSVQVIREGETVKCSPTSTQLYRFSGNQLRGYPNPQIAGAWDPYWQCPKVIDCSRYFVGSSVQEPPLANYL